MKAVKNNLKTPVFDKNKITIVGQPTITNDGVVSGFSTTSFIQIPMPNLAKCNTWEIICKFKMNFVEEKDYKFIFGSSNGKQVVTQTIYNRKLGMAIGNSSASAWQITESNGANGVTIIEPDKIYWSKIKFTGTSYDLELSTDGISYNLEYSFSSTQKVSYASSYNFNIGIDRNGDENFVQADIYLKDFVVKGDGETIYKPIKTYFWYLPFIKQNYYGINIKEVE